MFNKELRVSLNPIQNINIGLTNINFQNSIFEIKNSSKTKLFSFYLKNILFAVKKDKIKTSINNIVIEIDNNYNLPMINKITIRSSYIATTKKEIVTKTNTFLSKLQNLTILINDAPETPQILPQEDSIFTPEVEPFISAPTPESNDFFDLNTLPKLEDIKIEDPASSENIPLFDISNETNFKSTLSNPLEMPHELVKKEIPEQTIPNIIENENKMPSNSGHIKSKFIVIILVVLFLASIAFTSYEAIKYFQATGRL